MLQLGAGVVVGVEAVATQQPRQRMRQLGRLGLADEQQVEARVVELFVKVGRRRRGAGQPDAQPREAIAGARSVVWQPGDCSDSALAR